MLLRRVSHGVRLCFEVLQSFMAMNIAGVACRGLWCMCGWINVERYRRLPCPHNIA